MKNVAEGNYSTVIGRANKVEGSSCDQAFVGGYSNKLKFTGSGHSDNIFIFGTNNEIGQVSPSKYVRNCALLGYQNKLKNTSNAGFVYMIGHDLETASTGPLMILGQFNKDTLALSDAKVVLACGATNSTRKNAIEINTSNCKILHNLQLANDTTAVNAIVPPADPSNPTADEQTLATKAYVNGHTLGISVNREETLASAANVNISTGNSANLETDFSITIPSWAKQIELGIVNSGGFTEYLTIDATDDDSYASVTGASSIDVYDYNHTTKDFTFTSGGTSIRISSIRVKGVQAI